MSIVRSPQSGNWEPDFAALFQAGQYGMAAELFDREPRTGAASLDAIHLRARIYLRTEPPRALALLNSVRPKPGTADDVNHAMLLGETYAQTGDFEAADEYLTNALATARAIGPPELIAGVGYRIGRRYVVANEPALAREALSIAREGRSAESRLDAAHLETYILSREGRLREQGRALVELLRAIDHTALTYMEHRAFATHTLATLTRELFLPDAIPEIERHLLGGTAWPVDFRIQRFQATKALGWAKALQGDYLNAFRHLKQSTGLAPDDAWRTMALCDRAYLARAIGEPRWSRQELLEAEEAADLTNWLQTTGEEPAALLLLAELFAPIDAAKSSEYLAQFRSLGEIRNPRSLSRHDERFNALADYATAVVDIALGSSKLASTRLRKALSVYERISYDWRAARCALRLYDVTNDRGFLDSAEEKLRNYSSSWLAAEVRERRTKTPNETGLSPMQERVFRYICQGLSNVEIASELGRSEFTVANHAKAVLKTFGVSSRSALIAEAMKRNLL